MNSMGQYLIIAGIVLFVFGLVLTVGGGKLPGDISIERENFKFYFPITTSILLSLIMSLVFWFFRNKQ